MAQTAQLFHDYLRKVSWLLPERRLTHFEKPTEDSTIAVLATTNSWEECGPEFVNPRTKATVMLHQLQSSLAVESKTSILCCRHGRRCKPKWLISDSKYVNCNNARIDNNQPHSIYILSSRCKSKRYELGWGPT